MAEKKNDKKTTRVAKSKSEQKKQLAGFAVGAAPQEPPQRLRQEKESQKRKRKPLPLWR